jgi:hypothetical protein
MPDSIVRFTITNFHAQLADRLSVQWQGKELDPGPVTIELDRRQGCRNTGVLDYACRRVHAEFSVMLSFPDFADMLNGLGMDPELGLPLHAVIRSKGAILENHSFRLSGPCHLAPHALLNAAETRAVVLPGA